MIPVKNLKIKEKFDKERHEYVIGRELLNNISLWFCELRVASLDFKKINLRVASSFLRVAK